MATSGTLNTTAYDGRYLQLSWTASQSIANNTSTISWTLKGAGTGGAGWYYAGNFKVVIDGATVYNSSGRIKLYNGTTVASGTQTIAHNPDGSRSVAMSAQAGIYTVAVNCSGSESFTLTPIPRKATITSAPNFNDEENPVIKYSNPAGNNVTTLQACISLTGSTDDIAYRDISKTGTSYTFNLTDNERNLLRSNTTGSNSKTIKFYIKTIISGNTYSDSVSKTFSIVNGAPTLAPTAIDTNATTVALTGDSNKFIKYFSNAAVTTGATALKGASITSQSVICGGKSIEAASGTIQKVESATFNVSVTDNRKNTTTQTLTKTLIDYVNLTCDLDAEAPTTSGDMTFTVSGNYFNGSFGATENSLTVQYRYKTNDGAFGDWTIIDTVTKSGNTYNASVNLTGLDYKSNYTFETKAVDVLQTVNSAPKKVRTLPIFDWSDTDFNFNVPVLMNNKTVLRESDDYNNVVLSADGGSVYLRPNGTDSTTGELRLMSDGTVIINGVTLNHIIQEGLNGMWYYRKWSGGTAECFGIVKSTSYACTSTSGYGYYADNINIEFPSRLFRNYPSAAQPIQGKPSCNINTVGKTGLVNASIVSVSATQCVIRIWASSSMTWTGEIHVHAIGRWK